MLYELKAIQDSRKSFNHKAMVKIEGNKKTLISYTTEVAYVENGKAHVNGSYSPTTTRHIKEFLEQEGFLGISKSQIERDYM